MCNGIGVVADYDVTMDVTHDVIRSAPYKYEWWANDKRYFLQTNWTVKNVLKQHRNDEIQYHKNKKIKYSVISDNVAYIWLQYES